MSTCAHPWTREAFGHRGPHVTPRGSCNGNVTVTRGPIERLGDRFREGLRKLGKAPKAYTRSDDRIREDIYDRLMHGWVNAEHVEVQVKNGEVTLTGLVEERRDKRIIEDIIEDVLGVKDVHNQLKVGSPEQFNTGISGSSVTKVARS